jgi:hypothetical protein
MRALDNSPYPGIEPTPFVCCDEVAERWWALINEQTPQGLGLKFDYKTPSFAPKSQFGARRRRTPAFGVRHGARHVKTSKI